jgi:hypothetical protein
MPGPHLLSTARRRRRERDGWASGGASWAAWADGACKRGIKEAGGLLCFVPRKRKGKRRNGPRGVGPPGLKGRKGEGRRSEGFFFLNSFQNHFLNFSNFTQIIKPCIGIMMHKHLLFLTLLK